MDLRAGIVFAWQVPGALGRAVDRVQRQLGFALLLLLAGFLLIVQVRANQTLRAGAALPSRRLEDLTVLVRRQQEGDRILRVEAARLTAKLDAYRTGEARGRSLALEMQRELRGLRETLGLTPVHGPGLAVSLQRAPQRPAVPQAQDLAGLMNELWAAGAEAVAVNGVRLRATEGFSQQDDAVRVGGRVIRDPFSTVAIGDPAALEGALLVRGGLVDGLRGVGLTVVLSRLTDVMLPAYTGQIRLRFARPVAGP